MEIRTTDLRKSGPLPSLSAMPTSAGAPAEAPAAPATRDDKAVGAAAASATLAPALDEGSGDARGDLEALLGNLPEGSDAEAWANEEVKQLKAKARLNLNDASLAASGGLTESEAANLRRHNENLAAHVRFAGFGGKDGEARADAAFGEGGVAARAGESWAKLDAQDKTGVRLKRIIGAVNEQELPVRATALKLYDQARKTNDWRTFDDFSRAVLGANQLNIKAAGATRQAAAHATAEKAVAKHAREEASDLGALSPQARQQYDAVKALLAHDPASRLALQTLLDEGTLTRASKQPGTGTPLDQLAKIAAQPLAPGVDRQALLGGVVREIAEPTALYQGADTWTCTVTSAQIRMAHDDPAEYLRLVAGLSTPAGTVKLANGDRLQRPVAAIGLDFGNRSVSAKLWQGSLMAYAAQGKHYDPRLDVSTTRGGSHRGLNDLEIARIYSGLLGQPHVPAQSQNDPERSAAIMARIEASLAEGKSVPTNYYVKKKFDQNGQFAGGVGHAVVITKVTAGEVTYADPMGVERTVDRKGFQAQLCSAILPQDGQS